MEDGFEGNELAGNNVESFGTNFLNHESHVFQTSTTTAPLLTDKYNYTSNTSSLNGTAQEFDNLYFFKTEQLIFLSFLLVCIVIGNSIVLLAIGLSRRRHSRMHFFILHLALADLSVGLITVLSDLIWKITVNFYGGDVLCKMVKFAQAFVMFASTYMLVALSIDRYDAISRPLYFSSTWTRCKVLVALAWGLSALFASPMFFISEYHPQEIQCWIELPSLYYWQTYLVLVAAAVLIIPALIIMACYTMIIRIIWKNSHLLSPTVKHTFTADSKKLMAANQSNGFSSKGSPKPNRVNRYGDMGRSSKGVIPQAKIRTIKMTFFIVIVFIYCWSPYFVFNLLHVFGHIPKTQEMVAVATFIQSCAPLNSAANPIIYGIFSTRVCSYLSQLRLFRSVSKVFCCASKTVSTRTSGVSEISNFTDTEFSRRSPRTASHPVMAANMNVEMCDLVLSNSVNR